MINVNKLGKENFLKSIGATTYVPTTKFSGCITCIATETGNRFKLSSAFMHDLGEPEAVEMYFASESIIICPVAKGTKNGIDFSSKSMVYNTDLATKIMNMSGESFPVNKSVKIGTYTMGDFEDGTKYAEVRFSNGGTSDEG